MSEPLSDRYETGVSSEESSRKYFVTLDRLHHL